MATGVNFMIFEKRFFSEFNDVSHVNPGDVESFISKIPSLLRGYIPRDIYNADETGLFFRALPNKTFAFRGEKCAGGKMGQRETNNYGLC
jgi:hypothetical protein